MDNVRKQLTLFLEESNEAIEKVRAKFNPEQYNLIAAHITLWREDELESLDKIIQRIEAIHLKKPIQLQWKEAERFADGKGVLIPATENTIDFDELRKNVLGWSKLLKEQFPHITLMHSRNSTCTDRIFEQIKEQQFPTELEFEKISLIEQKNDKKWIVLREFNLVDKTSTTPI